MCVFERERGKGREQFTHLILLSLVISRIKSLLPLISSTSILVLRY